jgi:hypothetical protein
VYDLSIWFNRRPLSWAATVMLPIAFHAKIYCSPEDPHSCWALLLKQPSPHYFRSLRWHTDTKQTHLIIKLRRLLPGCFRSQYSVQHFLNLSIDANLVPLSLLISSWNSTSCPRCARASRSNRLHYPSPRLMMIKVCRPLTNSQKIPRMVLHRCWDMVAPGTWYSRTHRKQKPHGRCGFNGALQIEKKDCRKSWLSSAVCTRQVYNDVQAYSTQSQVCMREVIFVDR